MLQYTGWRDLHDKHVSQQLPPIVLCSVAYMDPTDSVQATLQHCSLIPNCQGPLHNLCSL